MANNGTEGLNMDGFPDAEEIIQRLGGIRPAAAKLGVPVTTVQGWKNRGRIPENRHAEVSRTLQELGVGLENPAVSDGSSPGDSSDESSPRSEFSNANDDLSEQTGAEKPFDPTASAGKTIEASHPKETASATGLSVILGASGLVSSIFALGLIAILVYQPNVLLDFVGDRAAQPVVNASDSAGEVATRIQALAAAQAEILRSSDAVRSRVERLERRFDALSANNDADTPAVGSLREGIGAIETRLGEIAAKMAENDGRLAEEASRTSTELATRIETLKSTLSEIQTQQERAARIASRTGSRQNPSADGNAIRLVAIGQLEAALHSGGGFEPALARVAQLLESNSEVDAVVKSLDVHAESGVASISALTSDFKILSPILSAGRPPPGGWNPLDGAWARVKATIGLRRIDENSPSPVTIVERALVRGDLDAVLTQTKGYGEKVDRWRDRVSNRRNMLDAVRRLQEFVGGMAETTDRSLVAPSAEKATQ